MQVTGRLVGIVAVGALLLGACSDDSSEEAVEGPTMDNSEETLVSYVEEYQEGFLAESGANTYPTLTAACQDEWSQDDWQANAEAWTEFTEGVTNVPAGELQVVDVEVQEIDEDSATIVVTWGDATGTVLEGIGNEPVEWIHENGGWRTTNCPSLSEALAGG